MTTRMRQVVARTKKSHLSHGIVMRIAVRVALLPASAFLTPISTGAVTFTPHEFVTVTAPAVDDLVIQSVGYLEFDWSPTNGVVPGFAPMADEPKEGAK